MSKSSKMKIKIDVTRQIAKKIFSVPRILININDKNHQYTHVILFKISIQEAALRYQLQAARTFKSLILSLVLNHRYIFF